MKLILLILLGFSTHFVSADDCSEEQLIIDDKSEAKFCFDPRPYVADKEMMDDFETLFAMGVFDEENCIIKERRTKENDAIIARFLQRNLKGKVTIFAVENPRAQQVNLLYTNSEDKSFVTTALSAKDKWQIAGYSASGIAIGALVSEKIYKGEADKRKHWMVGAAVSGITTGTTYLLLETAGLGDKFNLSKKAKKNIILFSGPVVGTVLGIMKEVYDSKHRNKHTVDANDAAATALGSGVGIFAINFMFNFQ